MTRVSLPHLRGALHYSPIFVGLLFLLVTALAMRTSFLRRSLRIFAGHGGNEVLRRASRAHGLAIEHGVPLALLLVLFEMQGAPKAAVLVLGILVLAVRACAAAGTSLAEHSIALAGVVGTYLLELLLSIWVLVTGLRAL